MTNVQLLVVRPQRHPHERIDDYLQRLASLNGFSSGSALKGILMEWARSHGVDVRLGARIEFICHVLEVLLKRKCKVYSYDKPDFIKKNSSLKICRICASKSKAVMFYWYLGDYHVCHLHDEPMMPEQESVRRCSEQFRRDHLHPILNFLDREDPWLEYSALLKSRKELRWLCVALSEFFKSKLAIRALTERALSCIEENETARLSISGRLDVVATLIALQSNVPVEDVCLVSALLLWRRMRPDGVVGIVGQMTSEATSESLEWASRQLLGYGPMLSFLSEMYDDTKRSEYKRLNQYIPLFGDLDQQEDLALRKVISFSGVSNELVCVVPSKVARSFAYRPKGKIEATDTVPLDT